MSDIKLFRLSPEGVGELKGQSLALEKSLQTLMEKNLETLLGVRFLASEYSTGVKHKGRIDTLGIDACRGLPFPPGGGTDAFARPLSAQLSKQLGRQVIIDNRGGAGGNGSG